MKTEQKFDESDLLVVAMNSFLKLVFILVIAAILMPFVYIVTGFISSLVNIASVLMGINLYTDWLGVCVVLVFFVASFYVVTGRYKNVVFRSWEQEDREGYYRDFEIRL